MEADLWHGEITIKDADHSVRVLEASIKFGEDLVEAIHNDRRHSIVLMPYGLGKRTARNVMEFLPTLIEGSKRLLSRRKSRIENTRGEQIMYGANEMIIAYALEVGSRMVKIGMKVPK